ncbi:MAG: hypothetical protein JXR89_04805 [Deltaproteobacteria bacterium]|nr:hypothetical protein [Deltaproteobacteria bacterium]
MKKSLLILLILPILAACGSKGGMEGILTSSDVLIIQHHIREHYRCLEELCRRLYLKNPRYEPDPKKREGKLNAVFYGGGSLAEPWNRRASHEILTAAFAPATTYPDRVALLALGLRRSIDEGYNQTGPNQTMITSLEVSLEKLKRLHSNLNQVNWRLKSCRAPEENLYFLTNEADPAGHLNMGYEVLMTRVLTRIEDDIFMRGGNPPNLVFRMSTMFLSLFL